MPRVWEKMEEKISVVLSQSTGMKKQIGDWARSIGPQGTYA